MKTLLHCGLWTLALGLFCGCASTSKVARELSKDNATVTVNIGSVYGTAKIVRTNPKPGQDVTISPDGTVNIRTTQLLVPPQP